MSEHLSDLQLDALRRLDGETSGRDHLEGCSTCRARQAELAAEDGLFEARFSPARLAAETRAAAEPRPARWWPAMGALAAAAGVAVVVGVPGEQIRTKGAQDTVAVFVHADGQTIALAGAVDAEAHLRVQVRGPGYARVLWSSTAGDWSTLYPTPDAEPWRVEASTWLPREVVLDGAPETETLAAVVCPEPVDEARAQAMLQSGVTDGCRTAKVVIEKR